MRPSLLLTLSALTVTIVVALFTAAGHADGGGPGFVAVSGSPLIVGHDPYGVAFSPDGKLLATADYVGGDISVFSADPASGGATAVSGSPFQTPKGPSAIAFNPSGTLVAVTSLATNSVAVYSVAPSSGTLSAVAGSPFTTGAGPRALAFSPDGRLLIVANSFDSTLSVFAVDAASGALSPVTGSPFPAGLDPLSIAFSPAGGLLAVGNGGGATVGIFSVSTGGTPTAVAGSPFAVGGTPYGVAFSPDGSMLGVADSSANELSLFFVDAATGGLSEAPGSPLQTGTAPFAVAFSPDGTLVATADRGSDDAAVFALDPSTGAATPLPGSPFAAGSEPHALSFGPVSDELAVADGNGSTVALLSPAPPTVTIAAPADGQTFNLGSTVPTAFSCTDSAAGPGLTTCVDSSGTSGGSGTLDTSTAGLRTYTVTAHSRDGQTTTATIHYSVEGLFPEPQSPPTINQAPALGRVLTCETGTWQYAPVSYSYQWLRNGVRLAGQTGSSYTVGMLDEGSSLACAVTARNEFGPSPTVPTAPLPVPISPRAGCPPVTGVTGAIAPLRLGRIELGEPLSAVRAALRGSTRHSSLNIDSFCQTPAPLLVGYGSVPSGASWTTPADSQRVAWVVSRAPYFTFDRVGPGATLKLAKFRLRGGVSVTFGTRQFYVVTRHRTTVAFGATQGVIDQIGLLSRQLTGTRSELLGVLLSLG